MFKHELTEEECKEIITGEAITLTTIMAILAISISLVVIYKMFRSTKGSTTIPGGFKFEWK